MSYLTEISDKIQTSVFKDIQSPYIKFFIASPIPNLAWGFDQGKTVDKENTRKTEYLQVCEEISTL